LFVFNGLTAFLFRASPHALSRPEKRVQQIAKPFDKLRAGFEGAI
jgi:hypothetical protein